MNANVRKSGKELVAAEKKVSHLYQCHEEVISFNEYRKCFIREDAFVKLFSDFKSLWWREANYARNTHQWELHVIVDEVEIYALATIKEWKAVGVDVMTFGKKSDSNETS